MGYALAFSPRRGAAAIATAIATAGVLAVALAACSTTSTGPGERALVRQSETVVGGNLRHRVDVTLVGDTAVLRSVVQNVGATAVDVTTRICGLDVDPNLPWADDVRCLGHSRFTPLAVGDSIVEYDRRIVGGVRTSLRVRHLLSPDNWMTVTIR